MVSFHDEASVLNFVEISPAPHGKGLHIWSKGWMRQTRTSALVGGMLVAATLGSAQTPGTGLQTPDAQVEANVLKALAGAPELATEAVTTRTEYGTVTLSGSVSSEALRTRAESLAANAPGVKKVVDELTLGTLANGTSSASNPGATQGVLLSDGTFAPAPAGQPDGDQTPMTNPAAGVTQPIRNDPDADQQLDRQAGQQQPAGGGSGVGSPSGNYPAGGYPQGGDPGTYSQQAPQGQPYPPQGQGYPPQGQGYPGYPQQRQGYPQSGPGGYPPNSYPPPPRYPMKYPSQRAYYAQPVDGGQVPGQTVTVPAGTLVRLRINQRVSSDHARPGDGFDGIIVNDVVAGGAIAIPRGAEVEGTVLDAKGSGVLKGRGELTLQLTEVELGGRRYPIVSDVWEHNGGDKTVETINKTAGFGAIGALFGAAAGGGAGAAVGGGIGAAAGLGSSATSGRGQVVLPSEAVVTFHLTQPATLQTVSEQEMQRLAYGVPAGGGNREVQRRPYPRPYFYPAPVPYGYPY